PGDVHRITGEEVNVRAGPSDEANIRTTLQQGDEVIELRREGNWIGVRSVASGAEGWVFADLLRLERQSGISGATTVPPEPLFRAYSEDFDTLVSSLSNRFGYPIFE